MLRKRMVRLFLLSEMMRWKLTVAPTGYNPDAAKKKKKEKHAAANYSEAWVEFLDKNVAKTVASMMNAQVIGGKKGDR
jgi:ESF2/ABP1 family protein